MRPAMSRAERTRLENRWVADNYGALPAVITELVDANVDLIVAQVGHRLRSRRRRRAIKFRSFSSSALIQFNSASPLT